MGDKGVAVAVGVFGAKNLVVGLNVHKHFIITQDAVKITTTGDI